MEKADFTTVVALARLCGVIGTSKEIYDRFCELCRDVEKELGNSPPAQAEVKRRPY